MAGSKKPKRFYPIFDRAALPCRPPPQRPRFISWPLSDDQSNRRAAWLVHWQEGRHGLGLYVGMCAIYLVYTPFFYLLLAWLLRPDVAGALSNRVLILLGNASYALYLLHWLPLTLLVQGPAPFSRSVAWAWVTALSLPPLAIAVYLFFEDPARRAIRRWAGDRLSLAGAGTKSASRLN